MEPTTQPNLETLEKTPSKKNNIVYVIIVFIIIAIAATILLKSKVLAPVNNTETTIPVILSEENKQLNNEIDSAIIFDNENDLKQIDKEFQP